MRLGNDFDDSATDRFETATVWTFRGLIGTLWIAAIAIFIVGIAGTCRADCREGLADRLVDTTHEETEGFFVATPDLRCLLATLELNPLLQRRVALLEARVDLSDQRHALMIEVTARGTEIIATQEEALASVTRRAIAAEDRAEAWYASPLFWIGTDIVLAAVGLVVGLVLGGS